MARSKSILLLVASKRGCNFALILRGMFKIFLCWLKGVCIRSVCEMLTTVAPCNLAVQTLISLHVCIKLRNWVNLYANVPFYLLMYELETVEWFFPLPFLPKRCITLYTYFLANEKDFNSFISMKLFSFSLKWIELRCLS